MTVRELIELLQQVDPDQDVYIDANGGEYFYEVDAVEVRDEGLCLV
jgi:hypothetical protein